MRLAVVGPLLLLVGCAKEVPKQLESGFSMAEHSMAFANFADGYPDSVFDAELAVRMFGPGVCQNGASPCVLTPAARAFVKRANTSMNGGRCEGFAVMSSLLASGKLNPVDFEGANARELTLAGNVKLQRELAYWFTTQLVSSATGEKTKQYLAKDVMPALAEALAKDAKERVRIGIVRKKGKTISGGHALTPIGYYSDPKEKGVYWLRVYDNNRPDAEQLLKIDTVKNRWEFEASDNPGRAPRLYYGDASNKNPLYLAPVFTRQGTLPCEFCNGAVQVTTTGGAQVSADGVGASDGELSGGATPALTNLDDEPARFLFQVPAGRPLNFTLTYPEDAEFPMAEQGMEVAGDDFTVSLENVRITAVDGLDVQQRGGVVKYTNASQSPLALKTELTLPGGKSLAVAAVVDGQSSEVSASVDRDTGSASVAAGGSAGSQVTMVVTATDESGNETVGQLTFVSEGDGGISADTSGFANGDPLTGTVTNNGMTMTVTNACEDGVKSGMESDVDCGAVCTTKCATGLACGTGADCASTFCAAATGRCVATSCEDGVRSGDETDVDCGGSCGACANGKACGGNGDCAATSACVTGACTATWAVGFTVSGLPLTEQLVVQNNGGDDLTLSGNGSYAFPTRVTGAYDVRITTQPLTASCTVSNGAGTATANVSNVSITCTTGYSVGGTLSGLPASAQVVLQNNLGDDLTLGANGAFTFATQVMGAYAVTVRTQPANATCVVSSGSGTATANVTSVQVTCTPTFSIGGTVSGLPASTQVVLQNNLGDDVTVSANGAFTFPTRVSGAYAVTVLTQPTNADCVVSAGSGTATADVTGVQVTCSPTYSVGGTVSGLPTSRSVVLANGAEQLTVNANGAFTFVTRVTGAYAVSVATQPQGATCSVASGSGTATANVTGVVVTCLAAGALDGTFNTTGWLANVRTANADVWHGGVVNLDDSLVLAGEAAGWVVSKVTSAGGLDPAFGTSGQLTIGASGDVARRVFRDGTGYLVVGTLAGTTADVGIARVTSAGALDTAFGTSGVTRHDHGGVEEVEDVVRDSMGRLVIVGRASASGSAPFDLFIMRVNADGSLDTTFGTSGWSTWDGGGDERATSVVIDPSTQDLVVAGTSGGDTLLRRYLGTGAPWTAFGSMGNVVVDLAGSGRAETPHRVRISGTNIVIAGELESGTSTDLYVAQFDMVGGADPTFGSGGVVVIDRGGTDIAWDLVSQPVSGWYVGGSSGSNLFMVSLSAAGQVSSGFFEDPLVTSASCRSLLVDNANRVVAVGTIHFSGSDDLGVARILP